MRYDWRKLPCPIGTHWEVNTWGNLFLVRHRRYLGTIPTRLEGRNRLALVPSAYCQCLVMAYDACENRYCLSRGPFEFVPCKPVICQLERGHSGRCEHTSPWGTSWWNGDNGESYAERSEISMRHLRRERSSRPSLDEIQALLNR